MKNELLDVDLKDESSLPASQNNLAKAEILSEGAILEFLKSRKSDATAEEIFEAVSGRRQIKLRALRHLLQKEGLTTTGSGKRGDPFRYSVHYWDSVSENVQPDDPMTDAEKQNVVELFQLLLRIRQKTPKGIGT